MLPSSSASTPSSLPAVTGSRSRPAYLSTALVGRTITPLTLLSLVIRESATPCARYSSLASWLIGLKGSTATDRIGDGGGGPVGLSARIKNPTTTRASSTAQAAFHCDLIDVYRRRRLCLRAITGRPSRWRPISAESSSTVGYLSSGRFPIAINTIASRSPPNSLRKALGSVFRVLLTDSGVTVIVTSPSPLGTSSVLLMVMLGFSGSCSQIARAISCKLRLFS